ncbi:hypothetical protein K438DRAFT_1764659 [Mycena galopus ATCC 62051]|nr:hypothetical protein K438DRAFT_1764659 [Mycena galopus ATCC 62051]
MVCGAFSEVSVRFGVKSSTGKKDFSFRPFAFRSFVNPKETFASLVGWFDFYLHNSAVKTRLLVQLSKGVKRTRAVAGAHPHYLGYFMDGFPRRTGSTWGRERVYGARCNLRSGSAISGIAAIDAGDDFTRQNHRRAGVALVNKFQTALHLGLTSHPSIICRSIAKEMEGGPRKCTDRGGHQHCLGHEIVLFPESHAIKIQLPFPNEIYIRSDITCARAISKPIKSGQLQVDRTKILNPVAKEELNSYKILGKHLYHMQWCQMFGPFGVLRVSMLDRQIGHRSKLQGRRQKSPASLTFKPLRRLTLPTTDTCHGVGQALRKSLCSFVSVGSRSAFRGLRSAIIQQSLPPCNLEAF